MGKCKGGLVHGKHRAATNSNRTALDTCPRIVLPPKFLNRLEHVCYPSVPAATTGAVMQNSSGQRSEPIVHLSSKFEGVVFC
jgi:hypothetical protein